VVEDRLIHPDEYTPPQPRGDHPFMGLVSLPSRALARQRLPTGGPHPAAGAQRGEGGGGRGAGVTSVRCS
jgi:hypothetical protein